MNSQTTTTKMEPRISLQLTMTEEGYWFITGDNSYNFDHSRMDFQVVNGPGVASVHGNGGEQTFHVIWSASTAYQVMVIYQEVPSGLRSLRRDVLYKQRTAWNREIAACASELINRLGNT